MIRPHAPHLALAALLAALLAPAALADPPGFDDLAGPVAPVAVAPAGEAVPASRLPLRPGDGFVVGFNQGWMKGAYGSQWTAGWDEQEARRVLRLTRELGGRVLRIWFFEGSDPGGLLYDGRTEPGRRSSSTGTGPCGIMPEKLAHLDRFLELAEEEGVAVYLTFFDGAMHGFTEGQDARDFWWNLFHDRYDVGTEFRKNALAPVLEVLERRQRAVYGIDLVNEINALVHHGWIRDWPAAVEFVRTWRAAIHEVVDLPVTASFGNWFDHLFDWGYGEESLLDERLPADAVDFHDFHSYTDGGIRWGEKVKAFVERSEKPVILGEFGESRNVGDKQEQDDAAHRDVTSRYLWHARQLGLGAALAWRLDDTNGGKSPTSYLSFWRADGWRPGAESFRRFAEDLPPPGRR